MPNPPPFSSLAPSNPRGDRINGLGKKVSLACFVAMVLAFCADLVWERLHDSISTRRLYPRHDGSTGRCLVVTNAKMVLTNEIQADQHAAGLLRPWLWLPFRTKGIERPLLPWLLAWGLKAGFTDTDYYDAKEVAACWASVLALMGISWIGYRMFSLPSAMLLSAVSLVYFLLWRSLLHALFLIGFVITWSCCHKAIARCEGRWWLAAGISSGITNLVMPGTTGLILVLVAVATTRWTWHRIRRELPVKQPLRVFAGNVSKLGLSHLLVTAPMLLFVLSDPQGRPVFHWRWYDSYSNSDDTCFLREPPLELVSKIPGSGPPTFSKFVSAYGKEGFVSRMDKISRSFAEWFRLSPYFRPHVSSFCGTFVIWDFLGPVPFVVVFRGFFVLALIVLIAGLAAGTRRVAMMRAPGEKLSTAIRPDETSNKAAIFFSFASMVVCGCDFAWDLPVLGAGRVLVLYILLIFCLIWICEHQVRRLRAWNGSCLIPLAYNAIMILLCFAAVLREIYNVWFVAHGQIPPVFL
ncbi:MAG: hypothetical protein K1X78_09040 [Verrucomicrobiaceae bacterium]|nr:hypothetical protein [Verrucomicrobiaceae bacterium]